MKKKEEKGDRSNKIRKGKPKRTGGEDSVKRELRRTSRTAREKPVSGSWVD